MSIAAIKTPVTCLVAMSKLVELSASVETLKETAIKLAGKRALV